MLLEDVKMMVLKEFNLPIFNTIFQSGGKFFILLPNLKNVEEKINKIQNFIDKESIERFNGEISLNLAISDEFCGKSKKEENLSFQDFEKVLENSLEKLSLKHKKPFMNYLTDTNNHFFIVNDFNGKNLCPLCRKFPTNDDKCDLCKQDIEIGEKLVKNTSLFLCFSEEGEFKLFNFRFDIKEKINQIKKSDFVIVINPNSGNLDSNILKYDFIINYLGNYIPNLDFEEISQQSCCDKKGAGVNMLGILKADVDNLGKIFAVGLKRDECVNYNTISRQSTLSRMFDLFFAGYINDIVGEKYPNCYILYSGGDDLVIVGPWDIIIDLAQEINNEFKKYTDYNPDITLSVGTYFCKHNYPFFKAVQNAEICLKKAKDSGKDSICLFNEFILKWEDFNKIYPIEMKKLDSWLEKEKVSTQFVRNLLKYGQMIRGEKDNKNLMMWQPLFAYNITKVNNDKEVENWTNKVSGMEKNKDPLFKIIKNNLSLVAEYALYKNRK